MDCTHPDGTAIPFVRIQPSRHLWKLGMAFLQVEHGTFAKLHRTTMYPYSVRLQTVPLQRRGSRCGSGRRDTDTDVQLELALINHCKVKMRKCSNSKPCRSSKSIGTTEPKSSLQAKTATTPYPSLSDNDKMSSPTPTTRIKASQLNTPPASSLPPRPSHPKAPS